MSLRKSLKAEREAWAQRPVNILRLFFTKIKIKGDHFNYFIKKSPYKCQVSPGAILQLMWLLSITKSTWKAALGSQLLCAVLDIPMCDGQQRKKSHFNT